MPVETLSSVNVKGGQLVRCSHQSTSTNSKMTFAVFVPKSASKGVRAPVLFFLSGLTCTDENFSQKAGAWRFAAKHNVRTPRPLYAMRRVHTLSTSS